MSDIEIQEIPPPPPPRRVDLQRHQTRAAPNPPLELVLHLKNVGVEYTSKALTLTKKRGTWKRGSWIMILMIITFLTLGFVMYGLWANPCNVNEVTPTPPSQTTKPTTVVEKEAGKEAIANDEESKEETNGPTTEKFGVVVRHEDLGEDDILGQDEKVGAVVLHEDQGGHKDQGEADILGQDEKVGADGAKDEKFEETNKKIRQRQWEIII